MSVREVWVHGVLVLVAVGLVSGVAGCAGEATETQPTVTPAESTGTAAQEAPSPDVREIRVRVRDGLPVQQLGRVEVPVGSVVRLTVVSDTADEVHVHSYDDEIKLRPGKPGTVEFTADVPGLFEVEMHESGAVLFSLMVS